MSEAYEPIIVAHRGLHHAHPENSIGAFRAARKAGVPWVECDVWQSGDSEPLTIVLHDETLDRTTTGSGPISSQTWEFLKGFKLRLDSGLPAPQEHLPQLYELMDCTNEGSDEPKADSLRGKPVGLLVEVKPPDAFGFVRDLVIYLRSFSDLWRLQSFDEANLIHALVCDPTAPLAFLVEDLESLDRGIANGWKDIYLRHDLLDDPTTRRLRDADVSIGVWTPNTPADLRRVMDLRADVIITNEPLLAMEMVRQH